MADPTMEVRARLTADSAQFVGGMDKAVKSANEFQGAASKLQSSLNAVGVGVGIAAGALIAFGVKSFKAAAEVERLDLALEAVGASSGKGYEALLAASNSMRKVGIQASVAQRTTLKFAQSNIDLSKASELATIASNLSVAANISAEEALQSVTFAVTTGNTRVLRQIGITTGASEAYQAYARSIGKASKDLTMNERRQAVVNLVQKEGAKVAGAYALALESPAKLVTLFGDLHNELQVSMGSALVKGFGPIIKSAFQFEKALTIAFEKGGKLSVIIEALQKVFTKLTTPISNTIDRLTQFITGVDKTGTKVNDLASQFEMILPVLATFGSVFALKAGQNVFATVPIFGQLLRTIKPLPLAILAMALTSTQVQTAFGKLLQSLQPLLGVFKQVASVISGVFAGAVMVIAKAITGLASIVSSTIAFVQRFSTAFKILGGALAAVATALLIYKAYLIAIVIQQKLFIAYTAFMTLVMVQGAGAMSAFNDVLAANPILRVVMLIGMLVTAFVILYKNSETFRVQFTKVFNAVASIVGKVIAFVLRAFGNYLLAIGMLLDINNTFGQVVAAVFQFVYDTIIAVFLGIIKGIKFVLDAFINLMENNDTFRKVVIAVFDAVIRIIAMAVTFIVVAFANILKAIASGIYYFEKLLDVVKTIVKGVLAGFALLGKGVVYVFSKVATGLGDFLDNALTTVKEWVQKVTAPLMKIPLVRDLVAGAIGALGGMAAFASSKLNGVASSLTNLFTSSDDAGAKSVDLITGVSKTLISASKGWGNYSEGAAGAISNVANKMLDFTMKIVDFAAQDNGAKIVDGLVTGAKLASEGLGKVIAQVEKMQGFKVGEFIVKNTGEAAIKAGNFLLNLAASVESFTEGNVLGKLGDAFGDIMASFKTGLGFGDVLEEERKRADAVVGINGQDDATLSELQNSADLMKKIREAMADGIKSMRDVLEDLQSAAKDFADSLKDTILNFAGLKSVELPDGFIPKAKSLIENMRMRLDKSQQFATQIATLQGMGLDTKALQDIIESGPIKGAQLAASILGGGVEAIAQINEIQKKISFTGAAIGKFGSEAAFGAKIAATQLGIAQVSDAEAKISGVRGNNIVIEQGAFVVNVDTTGATSQEEKADIITQRITETFAILAKELANK